MIRIYSEYRGKPFIIYCFKVCGQDTGDPGRANSVWWIDLYGMATYWVNAGFFRRHTLTLVDNLLLINEVISGLL